MLGFESMWPRVAPRPVHWARFSFALFGMVGYLVLVGVVGVAVVRERQLRRKGLSGGDGERDGKSGEFVLE